MTSFNLTRHARMRMQQRGHRLADLEFVLERGTQTDKGVLLSKQDVIEIEQEARHTIELAHRLKGTLVPCDKGVVKTVFKASRRQQAMCL